MKSSMRKLLVALCLLNVTVMLTSGRLAQRYEEVFSWVTLDYDWANDFMKQSYVDSAMFIPERNVPTGIKTYGQDVYVSVPRWQSGVPSTLNKVLMKSGKSVLKPFPSWDMQTIGDCRKLQFVDAFEIDPNTGWMWVVDNGRTSPSNICPAKLLIYDLKSGSELRRYVFPDSTALPTDCFLTDIVLDYVNGDFRQGVSYAYITDVAKPGLVVYDYKANASYRFEDARMSSEPNSGIIVDGMSFNVGAAINGIAISPDFSHVYFSPLHGVTLYQVPTAVLRNKSADISKHIRVVGKKPSQGDGMIFTKNGNLYFGGVNDSSVYRWDAAKDIAGPMMDERKVTLNSVAAIFKNETILSWPAAFAIDTSGNLWFTSSNIARYFKRLLSFNTSSPNFRILKTSVNEQSYLAKDKSTDCAANNVSQQVLSLSVLFGLAFVIFWRF